MVAALIATYLAFMLYFGGDGGQFGQLMTEHVQGQIKTIVTDEDSSKAALKCLSDLNEDISDLNVQISKEVKILEELIKNYDSKPEDFDLLFASALAMREKQMDQLWDGRQAMLKHIPPGEWKSIIDGAKAEMDQAAAKEGKK